MPTAVTQAFITAGTALSNGTAYVLADNVTMTVPFSFSGSGANITFDGSGHTITAPTNWAGLFSKAVTVSNLGVLSTGSTRTYAGWFFANEVGGNATNCYSTGAIDTSGGGIFGHNSNGSATSCYSTGVIGQYGGGIFGESSVGGSATNCYSTGAIGNGGGGIFGIRATGSAINCYSRGAMGNGGGGIFGGFVLSGSSATNCYSTGVIGQEGGGIFAYALPGTVTTPNCYFTNGGLWSDAAANAQLTGYPGQSPAVWLRYDNVPDTPYLLVANPQPGDNVNLLTVVVNGSTRVVSNGSYAYTFYSSASIIPVLIRSQDPHAIVSIQDLSGGGDVSGNLTGLVPGTNSFTIQVVSDSGVATATYPLTIQKLGNVSVTQAFITAGTALSNRTAYVLAENVTMTAPFTFEGDGSGVTFDGSDYTITVTNNASWPGLFSKPITVHNLGVASNSSVLYSNGSTVFAGWFFTSGTGGSATKCFSTGDINEYGGGIFADNSNGTATNCYSTGQIGANGGGIFGFSSSGSATNCFSTGTINDQGGGMFGSSSDGTATNCYSTGDIVSYAGGMFGSQAGGPRPATVINCYSSGTYNADVTDGIFGDSPASVSKQNWYAANGQWSDSAAELVLTGVTGANPVWASSASNTPYTLVSNPPPSSNNNLSLVVVNGATLSGPAPYSYTLSSSASSVSVHVVTEEPNATVSILGTNLSDKQDISGSLSLAEGLNSFTVQVVAQNGSTTATYSLAITRSVILIDPAFMTAGTALIKGNAYRLVADITMTTPFTFEGDGSGGTFDGSGYTITVTNNASWPGLFNVDIAVSNLGILSSGSTRMGSGWFFDYSVGGSATNCYSTGTIGENGGGIFGAVSSGTAINCYSTGLISDTGGGIFGGNLSGSATNCYSTGAIGNSGGGICGSGSYGTVTNCYSTGAIGPYAGVIRGFTAITTISNCYSTNGGLWSDAAANAQLTGYPGQSPAVWLRYNNVIDTPYLLVANHQPPSDNDDLLSVVVNGSTRVVSNGAYAYTFDSSASTIPLSIVTTQPHAIVSIGDLSGGGDLSGNLTGLVPGTNTLTITVTAQNGIATTSYPLTIYTPSNDDDISSVSVNGATVDISNGVYDVTLTSTAASVPVRIITDDVNATIRVADLSGTHDLSGSLSLPNTGSNPNFFTLTVVAPNGANATYPLTIRNPSTVILIDPAFVTANTPLMKGNAYIVTENLTMTTPFTFSPNGSGTITVEGSGHTITVPDQWPGLFSQAVSVSNLGVLSTGSTQNNAGWFFSFGVGGNATNCYSTGIIGYTGGGIFGLSSPGTATNCYSTGAIGYGGGGIFGYGSSGTATNCYSTGIAGTVTSGIYGPNSTGTPTNCYSTNGGLWSDADANAQLTGVSGEAPPTVWFSYNNVVDTPYLLVANPQPPSDNFNLQEVVVNGVPLVASGYAYTYTLDISASTIPIFVRTEEPHAIVRILGIDLSGGGDLSGSLTGIATGSRLFYIQVAPQNGDQMTTTTYSLSITRRVPIDQAFVDASAALVDGTPYIVVEDLSMNDGFLFAGTGAGITMDGSGHTVTVPDQWLGLFRQAITVSNLGVLSSGTPLIYAGYLFRNGVGGTATNCYSTGVISVLGGGIFGRNSSGTATNCYSRGDIGNAGGGIFGGNSSNSSSATNCYSTGAMNTGSGGIFGYTSSGSATNCYSTGAIGEAAGGIFGSNSTNSSSATNCYSTGIIGPDAAEIFGFNSTGTTKDCYFTNGGLWSDTAANAQLTGVSGEEPPIVWFSYNNVANTPYLLVANPQPFSSNNNLSLVVVNDVTLSGPAPYSYTLPSSASSVSVHVVTEEPNATVSILGTDLSGSQDISGSLSLAVGSNSFTLQVVAPNGSTATYSLTITRPFILIDQAFVTAGTALLKGNSYRLVADLTMTTPFSFSPDGSGAITFDGSGHTITVPDNWLGLFSQAVTVSNLGVLSTGSTRTYAGWFFASGVGGNATNCYSTGGINYFGGGIFGKNSSGTATYCYSTGVINMGGGGIFGKNSSGTATICYSTGDIGYNGGGIFGEGSVGGSATNCYSTGAMSNGGGGIFGVSSKGSATNCYSTGAIGYGGGGIFGYAPSGTATNCYSTGAIGQNAGGILGNYPRVAATATNCYFTNGGLWSDAAANAAAALTGYPGQSPAVWLRYNNVIDTPYLLVANPQPPSDDVNLLTVVVNGSTRVVSNGAYAYTFDSSAATIPVLIRSEDPHAIVSIQDLSGGGDVVGNLTGLVSGTNSFTIQVVSDSGVATASYPLTIQTLSNDDDISSVSVNGALVDISNGVYNVTLPSNVASVPVRIITDDVNARIAIEGTDLSGTHDLSGSLSLPNTGSNLFTLTVVAPNGANSTYLLTITNPSPIINIDPAFVTANTPLVKGNSYRLVADLTMTVPFTFSLDGTGAITVEGSGHTITVPDQWPGLFSQAVSVSNLGVLSTGQVADGMGWFFHENVEGTATNCYSTGAISQNSGGLFGANTVYGNAINCYSTGPIDNNGGGLFGLNSIACVATACYSTGSIAEQAGGLFGNGATDCSAIACYSTGSIGPYAGGLFGGGSTGSATNCYSTGSIGAGGGGLFQSGSSGTVIHCYSTNGGLWSDADANAQLTGVSGEEPPIVWFSYNNVANTPYLLVTNPQLPTITPPTGLSAPTLTTTTLTPQSVNLTWTQPAGATSYRVYESTDSWATSTLVASPSTNSYIIQTRRIGSSQFKVSAVDAAGLEGTRSMATAPITLLWAPASPTQVVATSTASGTLNLAWTPPTDTGNSPITSYRVYNIGGTRISANITFDASSATLTGLQDSIVYYSFKVSAVNSIDEGPKSNPSNTIITTPLSSSVSSFSSSGSTTDFTNALSNITDPARAIMGARVAINNASKAGTLTPAERQALTVAALNTLNTTGANQVTVTTSLTNSIIASMASVNTSGTINPSLAVGLVIPSYSTGASPHTATFDLQSTLSLYGNTVSYATMISQQLGYLVFELPNSIPGNVYQLTLTNGAASLTLTYDGTVLHDQNSTAYTANSVLQVGTLLIPLLGLGSIGTDTTSLALVTVNSSGPLLAPYAFTVDSTSTSASVVIQATNPQMSVIVRNSSGIAVLDGSLPNPGNVSGSLTSLVPGPNVFTINVTSQNGTATTNYPLTITRPVAGPVPCFPAGTRILTASGYKAVETLAQNEHVLTADGRPVPVKIYGKHLPVTTSGTAPYRVPKGTFGLANDLLLSPDHAFQIRKGLWMLPKRAALLSDRVEQVGVGSPVTYYHLECPQYLRDNLVVDGAVVESYSGKQLPQSPYTYNESLKGYTRAAPSVKRGTSA